jgi:hypothetical protein
MLIAASAVQTRADEQFDLEDTAMYVDNSSHDLQFFSPVDFDFENRPLSQACGYFFHFDKLVWAATGERVVVGDPNVVEFSEIIVPDELSNGAIFDVTDDPITAADLQYQIINGIQDAAPDAAFGWGERYELGYGDGETSWSIGVLDGPANNSSDTFATGEQEFGFGSIHVNFNTPANFLLGLRDYWNGGPDETGFFIIPTTTVGGPGDNGTGGLPGQGDGVTDDLDGDGAEGPQFIFADIDGDGEIGDDEVVAIVYDLDDLHRFNITYDLLTIRNHTETQGVELMKSHHLDNRHMMTKHQNQHLEFGYGVRFLRLHDEFSFDGDSPLLGAHFFDTETENQIVGPQIRLKWSTQRGRWNIGADGRCMFGFNATDMSQGGSVGLDNDTDGDGDIDNPGLVPGGLNRLISGQPTTWNYGKRADEFSPVVEFRADASYQVTRALAARLGYTGIFVDNISRAAQVTKYSLPDHGFREAGQQYILINGVNFGFDVVY